MMVSHSFKKTAKRRI